jgi:hypothetical protein
MLQAPTAPKAIIEELVLGKERKAVTHTIVKMCEHARNEIFPGMPIQDFIVTLLLLDRMYEQNERGREASVSGLAKATGIPRTTVQRKLRELDTKWHAIEQRGHRYVLNVTFANSELALRGVPARWRMLKRTSEKLKNCSTER